MELHKHNLLSPLTQSFDRDTFADWNDWPDDLTLLFNE